VTNDEMMTQINENRPPCAVTLGGATLVKIDREAQKVEIEFTNTDEHCHSGSIVQGGFIAGMLDNAMSVAVIIATGRELNPASLEIKVTFLKSVSQGKNRATGWITRMGRSIAFLEGELHNEQGELLAKASSTAMLVPSTK